MERRYEGPGGGAPPGGCNSRTRCLRGTSKGSAQSWRPPQSHCQKQPPQRHPGPLWQSQRQAPQRCPACDSCRATCPVSAPLRAPGRGAFVSSCPNHMAAGSEGEQTPRTVVRGTARGAEQRQLRVVQNLPRARQVLMRRPARALALDASANNPMRGALPLPLLYTEETGR